MLTHKLAAGANQAGLHFSRVTGMELSHKPERTLSRLHTIDVKQNDIRPAVRTDNLVAKPTHSLQSGGDSLSYILGAQETTSQTNYSLYS